MNQLKLKMAALEVIYIKFDKNFPWKKYKN
jgi:hypothetical protein